MKKVAPVIIDLNNGALAHFLAGEYDKAITLLRYAFDVFSEYTTTAAYHVGSFDGVAQYQSGIKYHDDMPSTITANLSPFFHQDYVLGSVLKEETSHRSAHPEPTCSQAQSPPSAYSMYNRGLVLSEDQDDYTLMVLYQQRTCAIILYNLALVNHNIGLHLGISAALPHALQLYQMSLETLERWGESIDSQKLYLAILNNMGNIHSHLFQFENTHNCLNRLRMVLAASSSSAPDVMDEDRTFFFLNSIFQGKELDFAPAA